MNTLRNKKSLFLFNPFKFISAQFDCDNHDFKIQLESSVQDLDDNQDDDFIISPMIKELMEKTRVPNATLSQRLTAFFCSEFAVMLCCSYFFFPLRCVDISIFMTKLFGILTFSISAVKFYMIYNDDETTIHCINFLKVPLLYFFLMIYGNLEILNFFNHPFLNLFLCFIMVLLFVSFAFHKTYDNKNFDCKEICYGLLILAAACVCFAAFLVFYYIYNFCWLSLLIYVVSLFLTICTAKFYTNTFAFLSALDFFCCMVIIFYVNYYTVVFYKAKLSVL